MTIGRRAFIVGGSTVIGGCVLPSLFEDDRPRLKFGVVSDVHIGGRKESPKLLETALRWLEAQGVDAVMFPGDVTHSGQISQLEAFAKIWYRVFPDGKARDGRKVEIMISTGNHDAWDMGYAKQSEEDKRKKWLIHEDNAAKSWKRLFNEEWALVWRKEVKGYTFIGSQWPTFKPELERYMAEHAGEFDREKPFFHCQHEHPKDTCHGKYGCGWDNGQAARAFAKFPNAVVFSGHSHCTIADERTVWQGAFTSIGAGCLHEGGGSFDYDNVSAFWHPSMRQHLMAPMNDPDAWGGDPAGGCFELVEVHANHLRVQRRSSLHDLPIGPDWIVPLPASADGKFNHERLAKASTPPEFAAGAKVAVRYCGKGHPSEGVSYRGQACVQLQFPGAKALANGARVFDYEVEATAENGRSIVRKLQAEGFSSPLARSEVDGVCLFLPTEMPAAEGVVFKVTPRDCFGNRGKTIVSEPFSLLAAVGSPKDGRKVVWNDDFEGNALDEKKWKFRRTMHGSDCQYANDSRTAEIRDGMLCMHVLAATEAGKRCLLSQGVATHDTMGFKYGYLEMRAKVPFRHGAWPSFWMQSTPKHKKCKWMSEVDIFEVFSSVDCAASNLHKWGWNDQTKKTEHVMLPGGEGSDKRTRAYRFGNVEKLNDEFHVYGFEWTPKEMAFYIDGLKYTSYPIDEAHDYAPKNKVVPGMAGHHDFHSIIFNNEVFTPGHGWCPKGSELKPEDLPIHYQIDWIRLWQKEGEEIRVGEDSAKK